VAADEIHVVVNCTDELRQALSRRSIDVTVFARIVA
jgi:hypothetical protein